MSDEDEALLMSLTDRALHVTGSYGDLMQDDCALANMKRQVLFTADAVHIADQLLVVINDISIRQERRMRGEMVDNELANAFCAMMPNVSNVLGFHDLLDCEDVKPSHIDRVKWEAHAAASGYVLAYQVYRLCERLKEKGLIP